MSGKDRQKFDFYCGFIDKLFKQINEMSKWDEPFLKNNLGKVDHALIEIKQLDLFFEKFEDFMIYKDKGVQIQDKIKSLVENMSPVAKMPETKVENKSSPAPVGKEAKSIDKSIKTEIDYAKIPISHYKRLIEGDFDFNEPIKKSKTFSKAVSESSNNLAPKPNFQAVSAKVLNQNNIVPNSVKEPAKPNVSDKVEQEFISASKPKVSSNDFRYSSVSNSTVSTKVRFCPACRQTMPQQNRNPNGQSPENHKERNFSSFRGRRPYYNRGRGSYINHGRFNR